MLLPRLLFTNVVDPLIDFLVPVAVCCVDYCCRWWLLLRCLPFVVGFIEPMTVTPVYVTYTDYLVAVLVGWFDTRLPPTPCLRLLRVVRSLARLTRITLPVTLPLIDLVA